MRSSQPSDQQTKLPSKRPIGSVDSKPQLNRLNSKSSKTPKLESPTAKWLKPQGSTSECKRSSSFSSPTPLPAPPSLNSPASLTPVLLLYQPLTPVSSQSLIFFSVFLLNLTELCVHLCLSEIEGPEGTVYAKGIFKIKIHIPERCGFIFSALFFSLFLSNFLFVKLRLLFYGGDLQVPVSASQCDFCDAHLPSQYRHWRANLSRHSQPTS